MLGKCKLLFTLNMFSKIERLKASVQMHHSNIEKAYKNYKKSQ